MTCSDLHAQTKIHQLFPRRTAICNEIIQINLLYDCTLFYTCINVLPVLTHGSICKVTIVSKCKIKCSPIYCILPGVSAIYQKSYANTTFIHLLLFMYFSKYLKCQYNHSTALKCFQQSSHNVSSNLKCCKLTSE